MKTVVVTQDRTNIADIIISLLGADNVNDYTKSLDKLEALLTEVRVEAIGWTWVKACIQLDVGKDPRKYEQGILIERGMKDLNPPFEGMRGTHYGDPCVYCGTPHDEVEVGDCSGNPK